MGAYTVLCTYLVKPARVSAVHELLKLHWPTLRRFGLVTEDPPSIYFCDSEQGPYFVEVMTWCDETAPSRAYWTPEINDLWTQLYESTEPRQGRPAIEYPKVVAIEVAALAAPPAGAAQ